MLTLVRRSFGRVAVMFAVLAALLAVFQVIIIAAAASFDAANSFGRLIDALPQILQGGFGLGLASFAGMTTIGYYHPLPLMMIVQFAIYVASEPAGDVEAGLVDLVLARPLPRAQLVTRSILAMAALTLGLTVAMGLGTGIGMSAVAPRTAVGPAPRTVVTMMAHLVMVAWASGAVALAVAARSRRRVTAQATVAVGAAALYLVDVVGETWPRARAVARLLPFHYYHGAAVLSGTANTPLDLSVLGAIAVTGLAVAYWQFSRRDL